MRTTLTFLALAMLCGAIVGLSAFVWTVSAVYSGLVRAFRPRPVTT